MSVQRLYPDRVLVDASHMLASEIGLVEAELATQYHVQSLEFIQNRIPELDEMIQQVDTTLAEWAEGRERLRRDTRRLRGLVAAIRSSVKPPSLEAVLRLVDKVPDPYFPECAVFQQTWRAQQRRAKRTQRELLLRLRYRADNVEKQCRANRWLVWQQYLQQQQRAREIMVRQAQHELSALEREYYEWVESEDESENESGNKPEDEPEDGSRNSPASRSAPPAPKQWDNGLDVLAEAVETAQRENTGAAPR